MPTEYKLHAGAFRILVGCGVFCCLLIALIPLGIPMLWFAFRSRVILREDELIARGFGTSYLRKGQVQRIGLLRIPAPDGIAGWFARTKLGGDVGVNLCWQDSRGKTHTLCLSHFEAGNEILQRVRTMIKRPFESPTMGTFGVLWP